MLPASCRPARPGPATPLRAPPCLEPARPRHPRAGPRAEAAAAERARSSSASPRPAGAWRGGARPGSGNGGGAGGGGAARRKQFRGRSRGSGREAALGAGRRPGRAPPCETPRPQVSRARRATLPSARGPPRLCLPCGPGPRSAPAPACHRLEQPLQRGGEAPRRSGGQGPARAGSRAGAAETAGAEARRWRGAERCSLGGGWRPRPGRSGPVRSARALVPSACTPEPGVRTRLCRCSCVWDVAVAPAPGPRAVWSLRAGVGDARTYLGLTWRASSRGATRGAAVLVSGVPTPALVQRRRPRLHRSC